MQGTHTCLNCEGPFYQGSAGSHRWFHAATMSTDCDHPVDKAEPKPEPVFTEEMIGESILRLEAAHEKDSKRLAGLEVLINTVEARLESLEIDIEKAHDHPVFVDNMVRINDKFEAHLAAIDATLTQLQLKLKAGYGIPPTVPSGDDMRMFPQIRNIFPKDQTLLRNLVPNRPMFRPFCTTHNRDYEACLFDTEIDDRYCNVGSAAKPYTWADSMKPKGE